MADFPPEVHNSFVWLYIWLAASTLNIAVNFGIPFVPKHMMSVLASDTMRPNTAHKTTITHIIVHSCFGDYESSMLPNSLYSVLYCSEPRRSSRLDSFPSFWAALVHWSALVPKALTSSRENPINSFSCPPPPLLEHHALRQSRVLHARHNPANMMRLLYNRLDALTSRLHERVQIGNQVIGAIVLSPTDAACIVCCIV